MITNLTSKNFNENVSTGLKLVEFFASWCPHCRRQEPVLKDMGTIWIGKVDGEKFPELTARYQIQGFPTFLLFKNGIEVHRFSGYHDKFEIMDILSLYIK